IVVVLKLLQSKYKTLILYNQVHGRLLLLRIISMWILCGWGTMVVPRVMTVSAPLHPLGKTQTGGYTLLILVLMVRLITSRRLVVQVSLIQFVLQVDGMFTSK